VNPVHSEEPPGQPQELLSKVVYGLIMRRRGPGVDLQPRLFGQEPAHGSHDPFTGALFGVDYSTITRRFAVLEPIVARVTGIKKDRTLKRDDLEILLIDATEHCQPFGMGQSANHLAWAKVPTIWHGPKTHRTPRPGTAEVLFREEEKEYNRALSRIQANVEKVIRRLKIFRVLRERYRNKRRGYGIEFNTIAGIVNLKMGY